MKVVAVVGMSGAGKSEVSRVFESAGFTRVRFGDVTDEEMRKRGLEPSQENERLVREALRKEHGMAAYARLNLPRIEAALRHSKAVLDGLYSWEEYLFFKGRYGDNFALVAVWASPGTRYARLARRTVRPLTPAEAAERDRAEIENTNKGGPIAMADYTILNESSLAALRRQVARTIAELE